MTKLHEILAVEKSKTSQARVLVDDANKKFSKPEYFAGHRKTLQIFADSPDNDALQKTAQDIKELPTTVVDTLTYALKQWADAEDVLYQKNLTNLVAKSDLLFRGAVLAEQVPVDVLLGLENRLVDIRNLFNNIPTLNASVQWEKNSTRPHSWIAATPETTMKTEKQVDSVVLYPATDKFPAQIKEISKDVSIGAFTKINISGAATSLQKAECLTIIDDLLNEVKQARMRANSAEVVKGNIGEVLTRLILSPLTK